MMLFDLRFIGIADLGHLVSNKLAIPKRYHVVQRAHPSLAEYPIASHYRKNGSAYLHGNGCFLVWA